MLNHNEQSDSEKIRTLIQSPVLRKHFTSYKDLCEYFGIEPTGGNSKKAIIAEFSRCCSWEKEGNKYIITEVFTFTLPKIDGNFLKSQLYTSCSYLLLKFLSKEYISYGANKPYCILTKRRIMKIMKLCNSDSSDKQYKLNENDRNKNNESVYFADESLSYLYKQIYRILKSLKLRDFINFKEIYMVVLKDNTTREATNEETKKINDFYAAIVKEYRFVNKNSIRFSNHKGKIYRKFKEELGFSHYPAIKFDLIPNLALNADYLFRQAKLTEKCGLEVNSMVCKEINRLVLDGFSEIREEEIKSLANQQLKRNDKEEPREIEQDHKTIITKLLDSKPVGELNTKIIKKYKFSPDDDFVKRRFGELIEMYIRVID